VSEKHEENYLKLIKHLNIAPKEFLMIGNSLKSDVLPVLNIGGNAVHVPFHITWEHEKANDDQFDNINYIKFDNIEDIIPIL
jgi:putative hydrolase of the HAD superfamily